VAGAGLAVAAQYSVANASQVTMSRRVKGNMNFDSDNAYGVHQKILDAINEANASLTDIAYGHDEGSLKVEKELSRVFEMVE
jgi:hypothetical protein